MYFILCYRKHLLISNRAGKTLKISLLLIRLSIYFLLDDDKSWYEKENGGRAALPSTQTLFPGKPLYHLCKLGVRDEKTSNNKKLIFQPNYVNLSLNPSLLKISIRKYHSSILKAFSKLKFTLAISEYIISTVFNLREPTWSSCKRIMEMFFLFVSFVWVLSEKKPSKRSWFRTVTLVFFSAYHRFPFCS